MNEHNLYRVEDSISELLCKDTKSSIKSQIFYKCFEEILQEKICTLEIEEYVAFQLKPT